MNEPTELQQRVLDALKHTEMPSSQLRKWLGYKTDGGSFNHLLMRMLDAGMIHKGPNNKWRIGKSPTYIPKVDLDDEPDSAVLVVEKAPGHKVIKFGQGWRAGKGQTARIGVSQSPIAGIF